LARFTLTVTKQGTTRRCSPRRSRRSPYSWAAAS